MAIWTPLGWNGKIFAISTVLGVIFSFQVEKLDKYNNQLFNLLFHFMDVIYGSKSILRHDKIHVLLNY